MGTKSPLVLCILDGWGYSESRNGNAIRMANTPVFDDLWSNCPHTLLRADGEYVGLPEGQFGNSEVGHMNLGAGRIVKQLLPRIDDAVKTGAFTEMPAIQDMINVLRDNGGTCHVMGLLSNGGVHAQDTHWYGVLEALKSKNIPIKLHIFTDGRDTAPQSGIGFIEAIQTYIQETNISIATISGRYYAMDRDKRWERTRLAYEAIVDAHGARAQSATDAVNDAYACDTTDEFIKPTVIGEYGGMRDSDALLFMNFRSDRARQILDSLLDPNFNSFAHRKTLISAAVGMAQYSDNLNDYMVTLFPPVTITQTLGEVLAAHKLTQLRMAETEKYPHVTFFFNNGREEPFSGEERILVPSPKVATYDLQPEMSAKEVTSKLVSSIKSRKFDVIVINYANPDMVGHTGDVKAAISAVETVDACLGEVIEALKGVNGQILVTADHGNADQMAKPDGSPHTAHTTAPVPLVLFGNKNGMQLQDGGKLADIAPTMLALLGIDQPEEMTGESLLGIRV